MSKCIEGHEYYTEDGCPVCMINHIGTLRTRVAELEKENFALSAVTCPHDMAIGNEHGHVICEVVEKAREVVKPKNEHYHSMDMAELAEALAKVDKCQERGGE